MLVLVLHIFFLLTGNKTVSFLCLYNIVRRLHAAQPGVSDWVQFSRESAGF